MGAIFDGAWDMNSKSTGGWNTTLFLAVARIGSDAEEMVRLLIAAGASSGRIDPFIGQGCLHGASLNQDSVPGVIPLLVAARADVNLRLKSNRAGRWFLRLARWKVPKCACWAGSTPLMHAPTNGKIAEIQALFELAADPNLCFDQGLTTSEVARDHFGGTVPQPLMDLLMDTPKSLLS